MNVNLEDLGKNYKLRIDYAVGASLLDSWNLLASNQGFAKWFPQLTLEAKKNPQQLLFQEGDFREGMAILAYKKQEKIAYQWDSAVVTFTFKEVGETSHIFFEEVIPKDFGNDWTNAQKDMTGWLVQNETLLAILNGDTEIDVNLAREKWRTFVAEQVEVK